MRKGGFEPPRSCERQPLKLIEIGPIEADLGKRGRLSHSGRSRPLKPRLPIPLHSRCTPDAARNRLDRPAVGRFGSVPVDFLRFVIPIRVGSAGRGTVEHVRAYLRARLGRMAKCWPGKRLSSG